VIDTATQLRDLGKLLEAKGQVGAVVCTAAAAEVDRLTAALARAEDEKFEYGQERFYEGISEGRNEAEEN